MLHAMYLQLTKNELLCKHFSRILLEFSELTSLQMQCMTEKTIIL